MDNAIPITLQRLDDQIGWYDGKSQGAQTWFKILKIAQLVIAGAIPLVSMFGNPDSGKVTAVLGLLILIVEGVQQLNQYQSNWISYRATCEALRHEKFLYEAKAGPYSKSEGALQLLAERVEGLISQEHAKWVSTQQEAGKSKTSTQ
jgi:Protein of unknown function (DUF4231)